MKYRVFIASVFIFLFFAPFSPISCRENDPLSWPWEMRLNKRQPPDIVLKTIGVKPGMIIGEVGAGRGRYTVHIASRVGPSGRIYANDIDQNALRSLKMRCEKNGFTNVETILGSTTDTKLPPAALDMVIMVNVVHELDKPVEILKNVGPSLKPNGLIVLVEGNLDKATPYDSVGWFTRSKLLKICREAGYVLVREETFLPKDNIYFLKK